MNHQQAWDLIPWLVNDTIDSEQRALLEQHLAGCPRCLEELQAQRELMQAMLAGPRVEAMPRASLQKLWARLDANAGSPARVAAPSSPRRMSSVSWLIATAACVILLLGASLLAVLRLSREQHGAEFRTVTDTAIAPATAGIRAVFVGGMTVAELQSLLGRTGLEVMAGPTASGVFTLGPASAASDPDAALTALRAHPAVRFAEPVGSQ